jgi:hypothetical protein
MAWVGTDSWYVKNKLPHQSLCALEGGVSTLVGIEDYLYYTENFSVYINFCGFSIFVDIK